MFKGHFHKITLNMLKSDITLLNNFAVHLIFHVLPEMEYFTGQNFEFLHQICMQN